MSSYRETVQQARRLAILLTLYFATGYTLPAEVLRTQLASAGFVVSHDLLKTELAWLAEMGFVELLPQSVARLTVRGEDIALGRSITEGVRRPAPDGGVIHGA